MKDELPIIFTTENIKLVMEGLKTETRRPVNPQWLDEEIDPKEHSQAPGYWIPYEPGPGGRLMNSLKGSRKDDCGIYCPYGTKGGKLYVRECFVNLTEIRRSLAAIINQPLFKADHPRGLYDDQGNEVSWKPSIHMPMKFSRTKLEVLFIGMERAQDITEKGCAAEGINLDNELFPTVNTIDKFKDRFKSLWDSIYAKPRPRYRTIKGIKGISHYESFPWNKGTLTNMMHRGKRWDIYGNPWVWVVKFKKI